MRFLIYKGKYKRKTESIKAKRRNCNLPEELESASRKDAT
jgi:hypothetical protein